MDNSRDNILVIGDDLHNHIDIFPDQMAEYAAVPCIEVHTSSMTCYATVKKVEDDDADNAETTWEVSLYNDCPILDSDEYTLESVATRHCNGNEVYTIRKVDDQPAVNWVSLPQQRSSRVAWALNCTSTTRCKNEKQLDNEIRNLRSICERAHNRAPNLPATAYKLKRMNLCDWFTVVYITDENGEVSPSTRYRWLIREVPSIEESRKFLERMLEKTDDPQLKIRIQYALKNI